MTKTGIITGAQDQSVQCEKGRCAWFDNQAQQCCIRSFPIIADQLYELKNSFPT